eukprot:2637754-Rhodomonas_salina.2
MEGARRASIALTHLRTTRSSQCTHGRSETQNELRVQVQGVGASMEGARPACIALTTRSSSS